MRVETRPGLRPLQCGRRRFDVLDFWVVLRSVVMTVGGRARRTACLDETLGPAVDQCRM